MHDIKDIKKLYKLVDKMGINSVTIEGHIVEVLSIKQLLDELKKMED